MEQKTLSRLRVIIPAIETNTEVVKCNTDFDNHITQSSFSETYWFFYDTNPFLTGHNSFKTNDMMHNGAILGFLLVRNCGATRFCAVA